MARKVDRQIAELLGFGEGQDPSVDDITGAIIDLAEENVASFAEDEDGEYDEDGDLTELEAALERIDELEDDRNEMHFAQEVDGLTIQGTPSELVSQLVTAHNTDPAIAETLLSSFKAASVVTKAATRASTVVGIHTVMDKPGSFEEAITEHRVENPKLSYGDAYDAVSKTEPELFAEYSDSHLHDAISL